MILFTRYVRSIMVVSPHHLVPGDHPADGVLFLCLQYLSGTVYYPASLQLFTSLSGFVFFGSVKLYVKLG